MNKGHLTFLDPKALMSCFWLTPVFSPKTLLQIMTTWLDLTTLQPSSRMFNLTVFKLRY